MQSSQFQMISARKLPLHSMPINRVPNTPFSLILCRMVHCNKSRAMTVKSSYEVSIAKNRSSSVGQMSSSLNFRASPASSTIDTEEARELRQWYEQKPSYVLFEKKTAVEGVELNSSSNSKENFKCEDQKEIDRRKKIGLANKGRMPWNKGKKHSSETRERIRQRTKEALMDPKVKKKMAECPRAHSERTKERIGTSLRRLWGEKLKWKRSRAKFLSIWAESIVDAAMKGGIGQQELDWNSYDKMKEEIAIQQRRWAANQAEAKEIAKLEAAQRKAERMARLAQKRKEQDQRAKSSGELKKKTRRKSKEEREVSAVANGLKLRERLIKIHKRKTSSNGQISSEDQRAWEKLDLEFEKRGREREVSLADQIQTAKTKRVEFLDMKSSPTSSSSYSPTEISRINQNLEK